MKNSPNLKTSTSSLPSGNRSGGVGPGPRRGSPRLNPEKSLRVVGLDLSLTSPGAVAISGRVSRGLDGVRVRDWHNPHTAPKDGDDLDRIRMIVDDLLPWIDEHRPHLVVIERYALSRFTGQSRLGELGGIVRWELANAGYRWTTVVNNTVKLHAAGTGKASKEHMLEAARSIWPECPNHDVADALHCARWAYDHHAEILEQLGDLLHRETNAGKK